MSNIVIYKLFTILIGEMNLKGMIAIALVVAAAIAVLPSAYAQESLCDVNGPTERGKALGIVCHTTQKPETMIAPAIPLIVGLGVGIVAWGVFSARKAR